MMDCPQPIGGSFEVIHSAQFRVLGERNPRLEHRHGERWVRMHRTIPVLNDGQPRSYRSTWVCRECGETVLHQWRAAFPPDPS